MISIPKKLIHILFLFIFSFNAFATEIKIFYKINDEVITSFDIENELNYLKTLNKNLENLSNKELINTAIQSLIREKIKKDENIPLIYTFMVHQKACILLQYVGSVAPVLRDSSFSPEKNGLKRRVVSHNYSFISKIF